MELEESFLVLAISTGAFAPGVTIEKASAWRGVVHRQTGVETIPPASNLWAQAIWSRTGCRRRQRQLRCSMKPVSDVTYRMLAADGGAKWRGLAVNDQYFFRWLNNFRADGPLPIGSTFNSGFTGWSPMLQWMFNF